MIYNRVPMEASDADMYAGTSPEVYSASQPWRPAFLRELRADAERDGMLRATQDALERANVTVRTQGNMETISSHEGGMLFIGNHERQFEFVALMDVLSRLGRTSMKNIVKFYVEEQVEWCLGKAGTDIVLPVYPRLLDRDRKDKWNAELGSRIMFHKLVQPAAVARPLTDQTVAAASKELRDGGVVNIFPCGSIVNAMEEPWRDGVGRIVRGIPESERKDVLVVPYHADNISRGRLVAAVAARGRGPLARPQTIDLTVGVTHTATEVMDEIEEDKRDIPMAIADVLRAHYLSAFDSSTPEGPADRHRLEQ